MRPVFVRVCQCSTVRPVLSRNGKSPSGASLIVGLVRKARADADPTKRAELYEQVSKIARTDALRVPLLFADRPNAATARVVGYTGIEYFGTVWLRP